MLIKLRHKGQLTIPDDVRRAVHLVEGDYLAVSVRDGAILLEPKTVIDSAQAWFWKADWQAGERAGLGGHRVRANDALRLRRGLPGFAHLGAHLGADGPLRP